MFGVVPRTLWEKKQPPDKRNRIQMATNCVLLRNDDRTLLIDTGYGDKFDERGRELFCLEEGNPLVENLASAGVAVEDVDTVVLSHLHFDHAGGATTEDSRGNLRPTFPRARYIVQQTEWNHAVGGAPELKGSYPLDNLLPFNDSGQLDLIEGPAEIAPGLSAIPTPGHTKGHQALILETTEHTVAYVADVCPMVAHLPAMWCMAYDVDLLESRRNKPQTLGRAADENWLVIFCHDPETIGGRLQRDEKREFSVIDPRTSL